MDTIDLQRTARETRRALFVGLGLLGLVLSPALAEPADLAGPTVENRPVAMVHVTDLYRPHTDPDDHWDLACAYALAWQGDVDLLAVFVDYPQAERANDPDVQAVAQLNYLTGKAVPVMVGSPRWIEPEDAGNSGIAPALRGIRALLDTLRRAPEPVVITILGSCRDVAIAGRLEPQLFAKKCAAIYLNAGSGTRDPSKVARLEWNVSLEPRGYAAIFELPCPVYWMPCFEQVPGAPAKLSQVGHYSTFYRFRQGDVVPHLSGGLQNFFAYLFLPGRPSTSISTAEALRPNWLRYLVGPTDPIQQQRIGAMERNMWCTGGLLHAAGKTVTRDGRIVALADAAEPVFTFDPIQVTCLANGVTQWRAGPSSPPRYIFHVRDPQPYPAAMTAALKQLLATMP
jgi:hypothetical protein